MRIHEVNKWLWAVIFLNLFLIHPSMAVDTHHQGHMKVDVYRSRQITTDSINKNLSLKEKLQDIADILLSPASITSAENEKKFKAIYKSASAELSQLGDFAMIKLTSILYSDSDTIYFTIDVVDKSDRARLLKFYKAPQENIPDPDHLIEAWKEYESIGNNLFYTSKKQTAHEPCPVFHCTFGFDLPELKKYLPIFAAHVQADEAILIKILKQDKDPKKREAAAYLLAHIKDGQKLIDVLTPSMRDPDAGVRNNVMRVLAMALTRVKNADFPIQKAIDALDYPEITDRNKALLIIDMLVHEQLRYAPYVVKHAGPQLMDELKMLQMNVHDISYSILKKISGKNYAERDYKSWELWLKQNQ
jgi:hypothetical protein